jgi:hypothetical protein
LCRGWRRVWWRPGADRRQRSPPSHQRALAAAPFVLCDCLGLVAFLLTCLFCFDVSEGFFLLLRRFFFDSPRGGAPPVVLFSPAGLPLLLCGLCGVPVIYLILFFDLLAALSTRRPTAISPPLFVFLAALLVFLLLDGCNGGYGALVLALWVDSRPPVSQQSAAGNRRRPPPAAAASSSYAGTARQ